MSAIEKLRADGASPAVVAAFERRLAQLESGEEASLPGDELEPVEDPPALADLPEPDPAVLGRVAVLKLNGGLGTSMGLDRAKSLVEVKPGRTFLDVVSTQVAALRERHGVPLPLVLMSSFATADDTAAAAPDAEQFLQSREPKLWADTHEPVAWPADPALEWCPPGHGDLYVALADSGRLAELRERGVDWVFVSNSDNLGAVLEPRILGWADAAGVPFVMEVVRGTPADRKGGHVARHRGRLVLRETAQVPDGDDSFTDVERWRFYNTNNLWIDLRAVPADVPLPLIVNRKTVDPSDPDSPPVLQLETAMGAAIGAVDGARAVRVPRTRFAPVKTTDDLLVVRSDAYELTADGRLEPRFAGDPPYVALDRRYFGRLADFEARFPHGPPSLQGCERFVVEGDVRF